jgi:hypothetical protein
MSARKARKPPLTDKQRFVLALANYLVEGQSIRSIKLQMGDPAAQEWARLRATTPLHGYPTLNEAIKVLSAWLGIEAL